MLPLYIATTQQLEKYCAFTNCPVCGYHVYKQVWLALVGDVLQCKWEVTNREDPRVVAVEKDGLLLAMFHGLLISRHAGSGTCHNLWICCVGIVQFH